MTANFPENSVNTLSNKVHDPVFFNKLASAPWGVRPKSQSEREQLLELATWLRSAYDDEQLKTASSGSPFLAGAIDSLKVAMSERGYEVTPTSDEDQTTKWASDALYDPELFQAAVEYGDFLESIK